MFVMILIEIVIKFVLKAIHAYCKLAHDSQSNCSTNW